MSERIQKILSMLQKSPGDLFLQYSLGMEYASCGRGEEAVAAFNKCIELDAGYLPAYVEAGKCLRSAGRLEEAREVFTRGKELADRKGERHVGDFIQQQLAGLPR